MLALLALVPTFLFAQTVKVVNKQLILQGSDCATLKREVAQLWKARTRVADCVCRAGGCSMNITQVVPTRIRDLALKAKSEFSGPNCWNSVLYLSGMSPGLHFSNNEMEFWLNSPLCELVSPGDPRPGDIFNFTRNGETSHVMRMLSPNLIFNKPSPIDLDLYEILNLKDYLAKDPTKPECRNVRPSDIPGLDCKNKWKQSDEYSVYRCQNFEGYVAGQLSPDAAEATKKLKHAADCMTARMLGKPVTKTKAQLKDLAKVLMKLAETELRLPALGDLSPELIAEWKRTQRGEIFPEEVPFLAMLSQHEMSVENQPANLQSRVELFRKHAVYDFRPTKDYLIWSQIYLSSKGILDQFGSYEDDP